MPSKDVRKKLAAEALKGWKAIAAYLGIATGTLVM